MSFVNKSQEKLCDRHRLYVQQQQMAKFKAGRMNLITGNIDINAIKMKEKLDFGQQNGLRKNLKPVVELTPQQQA